MPAVSKIDSNNTGLAYAEEETIGTLPGSPDWRRLNPNSYADFGGEITTVAPNPINPDRQRRKGVTTDLDASGGFNHNLTFYNLTHLMQGVMFADKREKGSEIASAVASNVVTVADGTTFATGYLVQGRNFAQSINNSLLLIDSISTNDLTLSGETMIDEGSPPADARIEIVGVQGAAGDIDVDVSGDYATLTTTTLDWTTLGLVAGQWIYIGGDDAGTSFSTSANNGLKRIRSIAANSLVLDKSVAGAMSTEASTTETIQIFFGDVLKNELDGTIVRRTYHVERTLGVPNTDSPSAIQSEVLTGAVPNEISINVPQAELANVDISFVATDNEQRTAAQGPLQTGVTLPESATEYNTSSDMGRIHMAIHSTTSEGTDALFAYLTELTLTINNNVSPNKAVGVLGAFDVTAGTFEVSGNVTAYFSDIAAVQAVRNNSDVTIDFAFLKDNQGIIFDLPLVALGDGRLNVEIDEPITLPLQTDAATGVDLDEDNLNHTLLITYFNYLPTAAM